MGKWKMGLTMAVSESVRARIKITEAERAYLTRGQKQPGGKLPIFDVNGQEIQPRIIRSCLEKGLAERWFANPMKPDWLVCKLTPRGRSALKNKTITQG